MLIVSIAYVPDFEKTCNSATLIHIQCTQSNVVCEVRHISLKQGCVCHSMPLHWVSRQPLSQRAGAACGLGRRRVWVDKPLYNLSMLTYGHALGCRKGEGELSAPTSFFLILCVWGGLHISYLKCKGKRSIQTFFRISI